VHIHSADKLQLFRASKGEEFAAKFQQLLESLEFLGMSDALIKIDETVLKKLHDNMMIKFGELIPKKMSDNGLDVNCTVCSKEDEAEFFFAKIKTLF